MLALCHLARPSAIKDGRSWRFHCMRQGKLIYSAGCHRTSVLCQSRQRLVVTVISGGKHGPKIQTFHSEAT